MKTRTKKEQEEFAKWCGRKALRITRNFAEAIGQQDEKLILDLATVITKELLEP